MKKHFFLFSSKLWWVVLNLFYYFHYYFIISLRGAILDLKITLMEVCSLLMSFTQDTFSIQFDFQDPIRTWLENSFMERYPLCSNEHIMHYVNKKSDALMFSIFNDPTLVANVWCLSNYRVVVTWMVVLEKWLHIAFV